MYSTCVGDWLLVVVIVVVSLDEATLTAHQVVCLPQLQEGGEEIRTRWGVGARRREGG